jgi:hypothetical protein
VSLDDLKSLTEIITNVVTSLGLIVGATWAYFRFFKNRTYRPHLEISLKGRWTTIAGTELLAAQISVKNVGAGRVSLIQYGSGLQVSLPVHFESPVHEVTYEPLTVFGVLEDHQWIEPGEMITDEIFANVGPAGHGALLTSRLTWTYNLTRREIVTLTRKFVPARPIARQGAIP